MLSLTRKSDYALVALTTMAGRVADTVSARDLAERHDLPLPLLRNILKQLAGAGLIISERGVTGGYQLARRPEQISLAELIDAIEGPTELTRCCGEHGRSATGESCSMESSCPIRRPIARVNGLIRNVLERLTLAHLNANTVPMNLEGLLGSNSSSRPQTFVACTCHERGERCDHSEDAVASPLPRGRTSNTEHFSPHS
ncbi:MAG: SUF system Fe-S cluster assembly regulator [Phycisphaerales bacterium]|nr:MAG: SUF system Fe-S cluster assembly regulator [Phycisphaerales bacterium]